MKNKASKAILISVGVILAAAVALSGGFLIFAGVTTLQVKDTEPMEIRGHLSRTAEPGTEIRMMTWNMGYGALDERQDCYFDGGKGVDGESAEAVQTNLAAIRSRIRELSPDVFCVQEADRDSKRSYHIDELAYLEEVFGEAGYQDSFAYNFKAGCVPVPLYNPTGRVEAGIATFSRFGMSDATRVQLPIPFKWPVSLVNLKRCLLITRTPAGSGGKEFVIVNLHLEAYDDGEGRARQLRQLMDVLSEEYAKGNYVVACGDFNQTFSNTDLSRYPQNDGWICPVIDVGGYPDFSFHMDDRVPTCRSLATAYDTSDKATHTYYMLDGFIISRNITVHSVETLDDGFKHTDHNPVMLTLTLE